MVAEVGKDRPLDTLDQSVWIPAVKAIVQIRHGDGAGALETLKSAATYDRFHEEIPLVRGQAYLVAKRPSDALQEFQRILSRHDWPRLNESFPLAQLGAARAYAQQGDTAKAKLAYQDCPRFLEECRSRPPHPAAGQGRVREAAVNSRAHRRECRIEVAIPHQSTIA